MNDGSFRAPVGFTKYWSQDTVESKQEIWFKLRMLKIMAMEKMGFAGGSDSKEPACNVGDGRPGFNPWVRKIPWRGAWQPTPVFLPEESSWTEDTDGLQSMVLQRIRYD